MGKRSRKRIRLQEHAAPVAESLVGDLVDITIDEAGVRADGTMPVCLITPGWGTSGYYSAEVLEAAANAGAFPVGLHMYVDHPTTTGDVERPERSIRDLGGILETAGRWDPNGADGPGIYAQAKVYEAYRSFIAEAAADIGLSIRAAGEGHWGEAEGQKGRIVTRITEGRSVDFVTKAGRGGRILALLESAGLQEARNIGEWMESRIHQHFTCIADDMFGEGRLTKDERISLSNGIGAALDAFRQVVEEKAPQLLARDLWEPPADAPVTESQEDPDMPITQEERAAIAAEAATSVITALTESGVIPAPGSTPNALDEANAKTAELEERAARAEGALLIEAARKHVAADDKVKALPAVVQARIVESLANGAVAGEDGKLDTTKLDEAKTAAVDAEVKYLAEATGSPVTGVGGSSSTGATATSSELAESETKLANAFQRLGLSENAAKLAVAGR